MSVIWNGNNKASILIVCDPPDAADHAAGRVAGRDALAVLRRELGLAGVDIEDVALIAAAPPMDEGIKASNRKSSEFLAAHKTEFLETLKTFQRLKLVVCMGKLPAQQWAGRPVEITKARGVLNDSADGFPPSLFTLSVRHALARPEVLPTIQTDLAFVAAFSRSGWDKDARLSSLELGEYEWCHDLSKLLKNPPPLICLDTETRGLEWMQNPGILTAQLAWEEGHAVMLPMCHRYYPGMTQGQVQRLKDQLRKLLGNARVCVVGHNLKYDLHMLANENIHVARWHGDTMQMAFAVDENMERKGQAECVRRWVPSMSGYSDAFDQATDKSRMEDVPHEDMLAYGCGDVDSCLRLAYVLTEIGRQDEKNWRCYEHIQMPALRTFFKMERQGLHLGVGALRALGAKLHEEERALYDKMIAQVPAVVRRAHLDAGLSFSRDAFVRDILFGEHGIRHPEKRTEATKHLFSKNGRLIPQVFTEADQLPSVSTKQHLTHFLGVPFVDDFIRYEQMTTMQSRYVGTEGTEEREPVPRLKNNGIPKAALDALKNAVGTHLTEAQFRTVVAGGRWRAPVVRIPMRDGLALRVGRELEYLREVPPTGFWKHLTKEDRIHPSFVLHQTVTGRSASRNPNAQNIPKHNEFAADFRRVFTPTPGFRLIEVDLSQIELRVAAWVSRDPVMLRVFRSGGDIHATTAAMTMGISEAEFAKLPKEERKHKRYLAKAVNFGLIYGQWPEGFRNYAKTQYHIDLTLEQATKFREDFFTTYEGLARWHQAMEGFVRKHGYVRSLHGALRRLPSITSAQRGIQNEAVRQAINSPVQRFASDLGLMGMIRFGRDCDWSIMRPLGFIHDANVAEAREDVAEECASALKWYMETAPLEKWFGIKAPLPILADASIGTSLADMEERPDIKAVKPRWAGKD